MPELNLMPYHLKQEKFQKIKRRNYILIGIGVVCIILLITCIPISELVEIKSKESIYKSQAENINGDLIYKKNENIKKDIEHYREYLEKLEFLTGNKTIISDKIHELEKYVPEDVVLESLSFGEDGLSINATSKSINSISEFTANVQLGGTYKIVRVNNIGVENQAVPGKDIQTYEVYKFTLNAAE